MNANGAGPSLLEWLWIGGGPYGKAIYVLGAILTLWGLVNFAGTRNRSFVLVQLAASLVPVLLVFLPAWPMLRSLAVVATAKSFTPPPGFMEDMGGLALRSLIGPVATVVPAALGLVHLARLQAREGSVDEP